MWIRLCNAGLDCILKTFRIWIICYSSDSFSLALLHNKAPQNLVAWNTNNLLFHDSVGSLRSSLGLTWAYSCSCLSWGVCCTFLWSLILGFFTAWWSQDSIPGKKAPVHKCFSNLCWHHLGWCPIVCHKSHGQALSWCIKEIQRGVDTGRCDSQEAITVTRRLSYVLMVLTGVLRVVLWHLSDSCPSIKP